MIGLIVISIFMTLIVLSVLIISNRDLSHSVILFMGFGLGNVILFSISSAPDVALTEAVIGTGVSGVVLLVTLLQVRGKELKK